MNDYSREPVLDSASESVHLLPAALVDGQPTLHIESVEAPDEPQQWDPTRAAKGDAGIDFLDKATASAADVCKRFAERLKEEFAGAGPDEVNIEFGVSMSGSVGAVLTKASTDASLKISATWRKGQDG